MSENESQFLETVGLLALAAVIALVSATNHRRRWQKASGFKHNYRWGLFLGRDAMLRCGTSCVSRHCPQSFVAYSGGCLRTDRILRLRTTQMGLRHPHRPHV